MRYFVRVIVFFSIITTLYPQQINISRVEMMPDLPNPYEMRDWQQVARGYDSLVFDFDLTGEYLPLVWTDRNGVNYPGHNRFGLHSVVGTPHPENAEGINVLAAVVSATLVGIDKSDQNGYNWVLMCEEFFNKRPEENVYLNNFVGNSGNDWWYDTMPNIFFYQLYDLYPGTGDFDYQFTSVADRWLEAVIAMNGSATPWTQPYMNYRAWDLSSMTPLETGVKQPEAAGAIAWLLYNAFTKTGEEKYRIGAEWSMEFLSNWTSNASYELQLPYGVYTAARMNAELGTAYDIEKLLNWCFTPDGNVRNWGVCLGNWGGYDCDGLIGEAKYYGYAFIMNGFEHVGALVPMVRYDDRFARAIGKWALNVANASRLFYTNYLDNEHQDSEEWAHQYDPNSYIAHESMREDWMGISPYATGDNWGATNLSLYGASHVGIFGGIIDTTDIDGILRLDVLKTDYFHENAYPTYLYYNPHDQSKMVTIDVGDQVVDIFDAVNNDFMTNNISGLTTISIPANEAIMVVLTPADGTITYNLNKMLVNGIVVDYNSGQSVANYPPRIKCLVEDSPVLEFGQQAKIYCTAEDRDSDALTYTWIVENDTLTANEAVLTWTAPDSIGVFKIKCLIDDTNGDNVSDSVFIEVLESINHPPVINSIEANPRKIDLGAETELSCVATDEDDDSLIFIWEADTGEINGSGDSVIWTAPEAEGNYYVFCRVEDGRGGSALDSVCVIVRDLTNTESDPVMYFPFNGNANDASGFDNHGTINGATLTEDRFGNPNSAYIFDGVNDYIIVNNNSTLNFQDAVSISFWMRIDEFFDREAFPVSHGSWENRWKISIIPQKYLRWTVKSTTGIKDLDTSVKLDQGIYYHIVTLYDGSDFEIYINGNLDAHTSFSGSILQTNIDLTIGQILPGNNAYNFKGVIDDIRIYDYALSVEDIQALYSETSAIYSESENIPSQFALHQNYPNPFNPRTNICYYIHEAGFTTIEIFNIAGQLIETLVKECKDKGYYSVEWNASKASSGIYFYRMKTGNFLDVKKCLKLK